MNKEYNKDISNKEKRNICVLSYNDKDSQYKIYNEIIIKYIKSVVKKLNSILALTEDYLCPYESIILYYMYNICEYGNRTHNLNITELYEITHIYYKSFTHNIDMHINCECKKLFPNNNNNGILYNYLLTHYEKISIINSEYDKFLNTNPNINILPSHSFEYKGTNEDYKINTSLYIGYNNNNVYNIYLHPTFNKLNHNKYLIESIYDTYFMQNRKSSKDDQKINGKIMKTVLFSCDTNKHYIFNWNDYIIKNELYFKYRIHEYMINLHQSEIKNYYFNILFEYQESIKIQPLDKIKELCIKFNSSSSGKTPPYILKYLEYIKRYLSNYKDLETVNNMVKKYILDYDGFMVNMKKEISESIDNYLSCTDEMYQQYIDKYDAINIEQTDEMHINDICIINE
jgi:hypothetical protein